MRQLNSKKFGKSLVVGIVGFIASLLLIFFVVMFFASHRGTTRVSSWNGMMTLDTARRAAVPSMMQNFSVTSPNFDGDKQVTGFAMMEKVAVGGAVAPAPSVSTVLDTDKKVMKNGMLNMQVKSVDESLKAVNAIASEFEGSVTDSRFNQVVGGIKSGTLTVKVKEGNFDQAFARLKEVATVVLSENVSGTDVTAQYIDLQARINNKKAAEVTLQNLFERAVKISDVMEVTDKLEAVRAEIESLEGQLRYMDTQTAMASITVSMSEETQITANQNFRPAQTFKESMVMLLSILGNFAKGVIMLVILGLPMILVYAFILWIVYRMARKMVAVVFPTAAHEVRRVIRKK